MSIINSFLQKRKMHENQHGFIMVVMAYVLSFVMLVVGSDVFYNISSEAAGLNEKANEEAEVTDITEQELSSIFLTNAMQQGNIINPYGIVEETEAEFPVSASSKPDTKAETIWLMGSALTQTQYDSLLEEMGKLQVLSIPQAEAQDNSEEDVSDSSNPSSKHTADKKSDNSNNDSETKEAQSSYVMPVSKEEIMMLERIVEAEASGEDMTGKILIANVVLNRIEDEHFPDSVEGVIFQKVNGKYQFSPVASKRYHRVKVSKETKEAVLRALEGEDHSKGALYFMARKKSKKSNALWFDRNLDRLFKHGGHEFYKNK